jgi:hypothetical protein
MLFIMGDSDADIIVEQSLFKIRLIAGILQYGKTSSPEIGHQFSMRLMKDDNNTEPLISRNLKPRQGHVNLPKP